MNLTSQPMVSIVTPAYNEEELVERSRIRDVDHLMRRLIEEIIDRSIEKWRSCL